jgi:DNA topoisomerase VI subunit A
MISFNPFGLNILMTYKLGAFSSLESQRYCVPDIKWLGLHSNDVLSLDLKGQPFESSDMTTLNRLASYSFIKENAQYAEQVEFMKTNKIKVEIQTLNNLGYDYLCTKYLRRKVLRQEHF